MSGHNRTGFLVGVGLLAGLALSTSPVSVEAKTLASGEVLDLSIDARTLALGEASLAHSQSGVGCLNSSPLGLIGLGEGAMAFTHGFLVEGISLDHFAYGRKLPRFNLGVSVTRLDYGRLDERDAGGNLLGGFHPADTVIGLSFARNWGKLESGLTAKYLDSRIINSAKAYAVDLAALYPVSDTLTAAAAVKNLGTKMKFDSESFPLPASCVLGLSWKALEALRWNLDADFPFHAPAWVALGGEYDYAVKDSLSLAFRAGVNTRTPELGGLAGLHAGFGVLWQKVTIDYSYDPFGDLGDTHRLSLGYRW